MKNKVAPPFKQAEFDIMYGEGVSKLSSIIDMGVELEIVDKSGAWFSYDGNRLGQGKENAKQSLKDNPQLAEEIEGKIRAKLIESQQPAEDATAQQQEKAQASAAVTHDE